SDGANVDHTTFRNQLCRAPMLMKSSVDIAIIKPWNLTLTPPFLTQEPAGGPRRIVPRLKLAPCDWRAFRRLQINQITADALFAFNNAARAAFCRPFDLHSHISPFGRDCRPWRRRWHRRRCLTLKMLCKALFVGLRASLVIRKKGSRV